MTAGRMLGIGSDAITPAFRSLEPYEVFALLLAILLHDAGNASGREGHERRAATIIQELGTTADLEQAEKRLIASIARAHGGRTPAGDKDTISHLPRRAEIIHVPVHAQRLAAVLRLADEFSENPRRADEGALREGSGAPPESIIHNLYCKTINISFDYVGHTIKTEYEVEKPNLSRQFQADSNPASSILLIDYIRERLEKGELERRYCNRFLNGFVTYDRISVTLDVTHDDEIIDKIGFYLEDSGYPTSGVDWATVASRLDGASLRDHLIPSVPQDDQS
ncbi:HD domain-containing protein [Methylobacterium terrae]|uniref:HD domain-containing protein n=1 Tax=Methylobacterium terrae TaxID=2202827 RepID=UPI0013A541F6|nr:hypothetical protein [Methylobacterium terrae]